MDYSIIRSNRKTVGLRIDEGKLEVRAPLRMPKADIERIVLSKEKWISDKMAIWAQRLAERANFCLAYGSLVDYRGAQYPIIARAGNRAGFDDVCFYMPPDLSQEYIRDACSRIYRMMAKNDLPEKVLAFAKKMSVMPTALKINGAKTCWGSCSSKKSLNFSWRLMMADDEMIDYVVVHELAHITEMNHSPQFWAIVEGVLPDYRARKARLKILQEKLKIENWE